MYCYGVFKIVFILLININNDIQINNVFANKIIKFVNEVPVKKNGSLPNIIIFLVDDLGYGDLGVSGHPTSRTPHIDRLARNAKFLNHFYVTSPICSPSRSSLLTGRYQVRSGSYPGTYTPNSLLGLPTNETTIAKLLKTKGYKTQIVGKWHLGVGTNGEFLPSNSKFGFDNYLGLPYSHDMCPCSVCFPKNGTCFDNCWRGLGYVSCPLFDNEQIIEQPVYLPDLTSRLLDRATDFMYTSMDSNQPFFLFFSFHHIHHPQFSSSKSMGKSLRGMVGDSLLELDRSIGAIVKFLKNMNQIENTLIWFTSDNGPSLQRHERGGCAGALRCGKGTTWDGGVKVPAFVYWKNKIIPARINSLTSTLDILPTISSITGTKSSHLNLDGIDISPILFDKKSSRENTRRIFAIYPEGPTQDIGPFAVVYNKFKAHFYTKGSDISDPDNYDPMCPAKHPLTKHDPPLLFDLFSDPGERYDLSEMEEYWHIIKEIIEWREKHMDNMTWMPPRTQVYDERAQPCCTNRQCNPFPACCDCPNSHMSTFY